MESSSASNRVFACPELLELILCFFSVPTLLHDPVSRESLRARRLDRATLASCAGVCRSFSELALDVLWSTLDDVGPLLYLSSSLTEVYGITILAGDLSAEWPRFQYYAQRVRNLDYSAHEAADISPSVWVYLARRCSTQPLLPNLRKPKVSNIALSDIATVTLLLSPTIREIQIFFDNYFDLPEDPDFLPVAAALFEDIVKTTAPHLAVLSLSDKFPLSSSHIALLSGCQNLRRFLLSDRTRIVLNIGAVRLLEHLGPLEAMSLAIRLDGCHTAVDLGLEVGFPKLSQLFLSGSPLDVTNFVNAARLAVLKKIEITLPGSTDTLALQECTRTLGASLPRDLRYLYLMVTSMSPQSPTVVLGDILEPLYALPGLKSFECDLGNQFPHISDDDLANLAHAWPNLSRLNIGGGMPLDALQLATIRRPTIHGLVSLARHCPRLRIANLPILETSFLPPPDSVPVLGGSRMKCLNLDWISARGPDMHFDLAVLLDRLFPTLEQFILPNTLQADAMRGVFRYLQAMQTGRQHSRVFRQEPETEVGTSEEESEEEDM